MRIGIQVWGSRGDIVPMLALADGLQKSGYEVTVALTSIDDTDYSEMAQQHALTVRYVASPVIEHTDQLARIQDAVVGQSNPLKQAQVVLDKLFEPATEAMFGEAQRLCQENDFVIGHFFHYPLRIAAELAGRPYASVMLVHSAIPSRFIPPSGLPDLGQTINRAWWWLTRTLLNHKLKPFADRLRAAQGLAPARDLIDDVWTSPDLNLITVSEVLCTQQEDWSDQHRICGPLAFLDAATDNQALEPDLEAFLKADTPPVYVSFGSVMSTDPTLQKATIDVLMQAADLVGCRMIIQAPSWSACGVSPSDTIHFVERAPHSNVFGRCRAVIHHGGAGTTHTALRAGVPAVVIAHIDEQRFWGHELQRIGVAPKVLMKRNWSASSLAERLNQVLSDEAMRERARTAASIMRTENGTATAVAEISNYFKIRDEKKTAPEERPF